MLFLRIFLIGCVLLTAATCPAATVSLELSCKKLMYTASNLERLCVEENSFVTNRGLFEDRALGVKADEVSCKQSYEGLLGPYLRSVLDLLTSQQHWVDTAGRAFALRDYSHSTLFKDHARLTAVGVTRPKDSWEGEKDGHAPGFRYLAGYVQDLDPSQVGKVDLWTDVLGVFEYSRDMAAALESLSRFIVPGGMLMSVYEGQKRKFQEEGSGELLGFAEFVRRYVRGFEVVEADRASKDFPLLARLVLRRTSESFSAPVLSVQKSEVGIPSTQLLKFQKQGQIGPI